MLNKFTIETMENAIQKIVEEIFGELQSEFDMHEESLSIKNFEKVKKRWLQQDTNPSLCETKEDVCECGHSEEHHENIYCGVVNCKCKQFSKKSKSETSKESKIADELNKDYAKTKEEGTNAQ